MLRGRDIPLYLHCSHGALAPIQICTQTDETCAQDESTTSSSEASHSSGKRPDILKSRNCSCNSVENTSPAVRENQKLPRSLKVVT